MATLVAVADLVGKTDRRIKISSKLLERIANPAHVSELAAALGTLEMKSGNRKKAKRLLNLSARRPNDNAVAQIRWLDKQLRFDFDEKLLRVEKSFEARTAHHFQNEQWREGIDDCARWLSDEPFSIRPASLGCYISAEVLQDFATSRAFALAGLQANNSDVGLFNNLAFSEAGLGNIPAALKALEAASIHATGEMKDIVLMATRGFINYRMGNAASGSRSYEQALNAAFEKNSRGLGQSCALHWIAEDLRIGMRPSPLQWEKLETAFSGTSSAATKMAKLLFANVLQPLWETPIKNSGNLHSSRALSIEPSRLLGLENNESNEDTK